jgi:hypothetical protein
MKLKLGFGNHRNKKFFVLILSMFIVLVFQTSIVHSGGISAWPAKLNIAITSDFPQNPIEYGKFQINNLNSYEINVSLKVDNPSLHRLDENYSFIPDLSWFKLNSTALNLKAQESKSVGISLDVPDEEKQDHYNEKWEVWVVASEVLDNGSAGSINIKTELAIRIFIDTPEKEIVGISSYVLVIIFLIIFSSIFIMVFLSLKRKKD